MGYGFRRSITGPDRHGSPAAIAGAAAMLRAGMIGRASIGSTPWRYRRAGLHRHRAHHRRECLRRYRTVAGGKMLTLSRPRFRAFAPTRQRGSNLPAIPGAAPNAFGRPGDAAERPAHSGGPASGLPPTGWCRHAVHLVGAAPSPGRVGAPPPCGRPARAAAGSAAGSRANPGAALAVPAVRLNRAAGQAASGPYAPIAS